MGGVKRHKRRFPINTMLEENKDFDVGKLTGKTVLKTRWLFYNPI